MKIDEVVRLERAQIQQVSEIAAKAFEDDRCLAILHLKLGGRV